MTGPMGRQPISRDGRVLRPEDTIEGARLARHFGGSPAVEAGEARATRRIT